MGSSLWDGKQPSLLSLHSSTHGGGPWPCQQSLVLLCDEDTYPYQAAPTLNQATEAQSSQRARAKPTAQTRRAQSSLPPATCPRSAGLSWALPSPRLSHGVLQLPRNTPKAVTHHGHKHGPISLPVTESSCSPTHHCSSCLRPSSKGLPTPSLPLPNSLNNIKHLMAINTL